MDESTETINMNQKQKLNTINHWIFDMDGTLTISAHDFDFMRAELGLPENVPILEALYAIPIQQSTPLWEKLNEMEFYFAGKSTIMDGTAELLEKLYSRGALLGILTRNVFPVVKETLQTCGIANFFKAEHILDRDACAPKPSPDGIYHLLNYWQAEAQDTIMVGDYLYDLQAGKSAGVTTIHLDSLGEETWPEYTDIYIREFSEIVGLVG